MAILLSRNSTKFKLKPYISNEFISLRQSTLVRVISSFTFTAKHCLSVLLATDVERNSVCDNVPIQVITFTKNTIYLIMQKRTDHAHVVVTKLSACHSMLFSYYFFKDKQLEW